MRGLFDALDHIHSRKYIHRDIKPNNVLYNFRSKRTLVVDFGLVQRLAKPKPHSSRQKSAIGDQGGQMAQMGTCTCSSTAVAAAPAAASTSAQAAHEAEQPSLGANAPQVPLGQNTSVSNVSNVQRQPSRGGAAPAASKGKKEGKKEELRDALPSWEAARNGTRGFRAPEVLMGCPDQTAAIDVWSAAVILLCLLIKRYPIFEAHNDAHALVEIAEALPKDEVLEGTKALDRVITVVVDGTSRGETGWVRNALRDSGGAAVSEWGRRLLDKCMRFDPATRLTAREASKFCKVRVEAGGKGVGHAGKGVGHAGGLKRARHF